MNTFVIVLFLHIVGALGLFMALGLEWTGLWQLQSAMTLEQARAGMGIFESLRKIGFISMLVTVISGIYMMVVGGGPTAWLIVTVGSLVFVIVLSLALSGPRMAAIGQALATEKGSLSGTYHRLANNPFLWISIQTRIAVALGIVFLKIAKPDLSGSLLTIAVAIVLGIASALPVFRRGRAQAWPAD